MGATPLFRIFLMDAERAARTGDRIRAAKLGGLALDFSPPDRVPAVLYAIGALRAELSASTLGETSNGSGRRITTTPAPHLGEAERRVSPGRPPGMGRPGRSSLPARAAIFVLCMASVGLARFWLGVGEARLLPSLPVFRDPLELAAAALRLGKTAEAVALAGSARVGPEREGERLYLLGEARMAEGDTAGAARAWSEAAAADPEGGSLAMRAGAALGELGRAYGAADAYLYALSPGRTIAERDRIASAQETAGFVERARWIREGGSGGSRQPRSGAP